MTEFSTNLMILCNDYYMFALPHFRRHHPSVSLTLLLVLMFVLPGEAYFVPYNPSERAHEQAPNTGYLCESVDAKQHSQQCPITRTIITDAGLCSRYAREHNMPYGGPAGGEWEAGCIMNGGRVYFSDPAEPRTSRRLRQPDGGSICLNAFNILSGQ